MPAGYQGARASPGQLVGGLLPWALALGFYLLLPWRLGRVLALDLEALVHNQAEGLAARVDSGALAGELLLLRWAALPLVLVTTLRLLYALRRWLRGTADPLGRAPLWARVVIFAVALAPLVLLAGPCARALSVWLSVEAYAWIQWSGNVQPAMGWILEQAPDPLRGLVILCGAILLWLALRRGSQGGPGPGIRRTGWPRRLLRWGLAPVLAVPLAVLALVLGFRGPGLASSPGLGAFEQTCGNCHIRSRPLFFIKTPAQWHTTVTRMRQLEEAPLSGQQVADVAVFLGRMRGYSDRWTFATRCQRCHGPGSLAWQHRPAADWRRIIGRLARHSPYYFQAPVRRQLQRHLASTLGDEQATLGLTTERYQRVMKLADVCATCHPITRGARRSRALDAAGVLRLLGRMNNKLPRQVGRPELQAWVRTYRWLVSDEAAQRRLFPHHTPATGGLPW